MNTTLIQEVRLLSEEKNSVMSELDFKKQRFVHMYLTGHYKNSELAELFEVSDSTIRTWLKKPEIKQAIEEMQNDIHQSVSNQLKNLTVKAVGRLSDLTESPIDGVALQAVNSILDRAGHRPKQEIKVDKTVTTIEQKMKQLIESTIDDYEIMEEVVDDE